MKEKQMLIKIDTTEEDSESDLKVLNKEPTVRGFSKLEFEDHYGQICSLQNSSLASEGAVWFGVGNTGSRLDGPNGQRNEEVGARMHLTRKQIESLMPYLKVFVELGYIPDDINPEDMWVTNES